MIGLHIGEPDFPTPPHIVQAGRQALSDGWTRYVANAGIPELRAALYAALTALVDPGDQVLLPDPGWPNYAMMVRLCRAEALRYPLERDAGFLPDIAGLERLVTPRTGCWC